MSYVIKGYPGATLVGTFPKYDAETKTTTYRYEYHGPMDAIRGMEFQLRQRGFSYQIDHDGPVWRLTTEEPLYDLDDDPDRWEIYTEATEKSLFEIPAIADIAAVHDAAALTNDDDSFKKTIETIVDSPSTRFGGTPSVQNLVAHLRSGVTGWQVDLLVLRRVRRIERYLANNGVRMNLDVGLYLYTTSQLNLPSDIAFAMPATPDDVMFGDDITIAKWRWRKRSQRIEYVGNFAEQTVELVFAPWSVLAYEEAPSDLAW